MPRWLLLLVSCVVLAVALYGVAVAGHFFNAPPPPDSVGCTAEAKQCPDGSYVGRTGPRCEFAPCPGADTSPTSSPASITVDAQINKSATALGIGLLPLAVMEDSRCPINAECIWAGTVKVKTRIHSAMGDSDMIFTLSTPVTTEAETITLLEVLPAPRAGVKIAPTQYHFIFEIAKRTQ